MRLHAAAYRSITGTGLIACALALLAWSPANAQQFNSDNYLSKPPGVATNVCVESTARDAYMRDYYVTFAEDCSATYDQAKHDATLRNMADHFGVVATSDQIVEAWQRTPCASRSSTARTGAGPARRRGCGRAPRSRASLRARRAGRTRRCPWA